MPEEGIVRLLGDAIADPSSAHRATRSELYLVVGDAATFTSGQSLPAHVS
jgi:hypothetical protein